MTCMCAVRQIEGFSGFSHAPLFLQMRGVGQAQRVTLDQMRRPDAGKGKHSMPASSMEKYVPPAARGRTGSSAQGMGPCSRSCMECASNSRVRSLDGRVIVNMHAALRVFSWGSDEVIQVGVGSPHWPLKQLRGFLLHRLGLMHCPVYQSVGHRFCMGEKWPLRSVHAAARRPSGWPSASRAC